MKGTIVRFLRSAVSTAAAAWFAKLQADPRYLVAAPVLAALGKFLRGRWPKLGPFLPF